MKALSHLIYCGLALALVAGGTACSHDDSNTTTAPMNKQERKHLRAGNKEYHAQHFADAEVEYRKALTANPTSGPAVFNLGSALIRQGNVASQDQNDPSQQAEAALMQLCKQSNDRRLLNKAWYDLGNLAYHRQQYDQAIERYKNALRCDPLDDEARDNLRLAQIKKQDQDQNKDNKDQNKDQNKDNQDQNQDQNQDKQDQNQDQNQDQQNQDKQNQDQQNQDKQNQDQQQDQGQQDQGQQDKQQQQKGGMSQQNAEQILKTMQNQENATQQKLNAVRARQQQRERNRTSNKW